VSATPSTAMYNTDMAKGLRRAIFSELRPGTVVIVQDGIEMIPGTIAQVGVGHNKMFCTVNVAVGLKEYYFESIWKTT